jgi:SAM-dependent methyltransferase
MDTATRYVYAESPDAAEHTRLRLLEAAADPDTLRFFDRIGVSRGWRCLEVGGGAGSIARALADRVAPTGEVVVIDLDLRFLLSSAGPNLEVRRADILTSEIEPAGFDLAHTRHLLAHLGDRAGAAVARMVSTLRPGGWLVVEDIDMAAFIGAAVPGRREALAEVLAGFHRLIVSRGGDPEIGRRLPELLERAGLVDITVEARLPFMRAGDHRLPVTVATIDALAPMLVAAGVAAGAVDEVLAEYARPDYRGFDMPQIAVWGRRPD